MHTCVKVGNDILKTVTCVEEITDKQTNRQMNILAKIEIFGK